jgi:hypothetical protein
LSLQLLKKKSVFAFFILISTAWVVFGNSLLNGFVWDDFILIVNNQTYKNFDLVKIFTSLANGFEYLPIRDISYAVDNIIGENNPTVFHASNVFLFSVTVLTILIYARLTFRLNQSINSVNQNANVAGFITALLFAVHPIHSEVVNFITCRNALLSTLFFFASVSMFLTVFSRPQTASVKSLTFFSAIIFYLFSIFSKANSIILPLILLLHSLHIDNSKKNKYYIGILPFLGISIAVFFLFTKVAANVSIITDGIESWTVNGFVTKTVRALQILVFYAWKLIYPFGYSADYDNVFYWSPATPAVIAIFLGILLLMVTSFYLRKRYPLLFFSLCWYFISLIPVLNFFATSPTVADRYAFLPSFAFFFLIASAGIKLSAHIKPVWLIASCVALTLFWSILSYSRNSVWFSDETLWTATIKTSPKSIKGYRNLGCIYFKNGDYNKAIEIFSNIADSDPLYYHALGFKAYIDGNLQDAMNYFKKALGRNMSFIGSLYYLGVVYDETGQKEMASEYFKHTIRSNEPDIEGLKGKAQTKLNSR